MPSAVWTATLIRCVAAGVDYIEFGYKASKKIFAPGKFGRWKFCDEGDLRRITGDKKPQGLKITVMADATRTDYHTDILPSEKSVKSVLINALAPPFSQLKNLILYLPLRVPEPSTAWA